MASPTADVDMGSTEAVNISDIIPSIDQFCGPLVTSAAFRSLRLLFFDVLIRMVPQCVFTARYGFADRCVCPVLAVSDNHGQSGLYDRQRSFVLAEILIHSTIGKGCAFRSAHVGQSRYTPLLGYA